MRRGLQITSIVILSPVLLVLISLMTVLGYSLYSYITSSYMISTVTTTAMMTTSLSKRTFSTRQRMVKRLFSKTKLPIAWFILCLLCYIIHKVRILKKKKYWEMKNFHVLGFWDLTLLKNIEKKIWHTKPTSPRFTTCQSQDTTQETQETKNNQQKV